MLGQQNLNRVSLESQKGKYKAEIFINVLKSGLVWEVGLGYGGKFGGHSKDFEPIDSRCQCAIISYSFSLELSS